MNAAESEATKIIMDAMRDAIREVVIKPLVADIIAGGYGANPFAARPNAPPVRLEYPISSLGPPPPDNPFSGDKAQTALRTRFYP